MLTKEQRDNLITNNTKLVYYVAHRYFAQYKNAEFFEDLISEGFIGLIKAVDTFDNTKSRLTTYATYCIYNQIVMWFRHYEKHKKLHTISLNTPISISSTETKPLIDVLKSEEDIINDYIQLEKYNEQSEIIQLFLIESDIKTKQIFNARLAGEKQRSIANLVGLAQPNVAKHIKTKINKIKLKQKTYKIENIPNKPLRSNYNTYSEYAQAYQNWHKYNKETLL